MPKYLIDINLPYFIEIFNNPDFIHQRNFDEKADDSVIWNYAKNNNLIIITKDTDFYNRMLINEPPPKVIHLKIGNQSTKELSIFLNKRWTQIENLIENSKMIIVRKDSFEVIA